MKIRVMVVEDEPPIQRSICQKIEETNKNFTVVAAIDNGKDALQYLKEHPVDVMFVDMNLPIVSGKELLDFCSNEKLSVLPVVLSGYTDFEYVKCAITNHAIDYLLKPLKVQELKLVLEKIEENESISIALFTDGYSNAFKNKLDLFNSIESTLQEYNKSIFSRFRLVNTYVNYLNSISKNITHDDISIVFIV